MLKMEEKILKEGVILPGGVLKVGSFLNQQIDVPFFREMGDEIARLFEGSGATKILTIEASGIAVAVAAGFAMNLPVVFAKKKGCANVSGDTVQALVHSYTHNVDNYVVVSKEYLPSGEKILIVDDFLAHGSGLSGLIKIAEDAGCEVVGCCAAIEKGFQKGGDELRGRGIHIESLAIIESLDNCTITLK